MATFSAALTSWLAFLSSMGSEVEQQMNPPAEISDLIQLETALDKALPQDLKSLYLYANGQKEYYPAENLAEDKLIGPFFGSYDFLSTQAALQEWQFWVNIVAELGSANDLVSDNEHITVRYGDAVDSIYYQQSWFPFAVDGGGNALAVDLDPPIGGIYGQVINMGSDDNERRVIASSLGELLNSAATNLEATEILSSLEEMPYLYFNIEGRLDSAETEGVVPEASFDESRIAQIEQYVSELHKWLDNKTPPLSDQTRDEVRFAMHDILQFAYEPILQEDDMTSYLESLAVRIAVNDRLGLYLEQTRPIIEATQLMHDWMLFYGLWGSDQHTSAQAVLTNSDGERDQLLKLYNIEFFGESAYSVSRRIVD